MKILMSRARFADLCCGLSPIEREKLAEHVQLYPEEMPRGWPLGCQVDQDRLADAFARLRAADEHQRQLAQSTRLHVYWHAGRRNGHTRPDLGPPWVQAGPQLWIAPAGTPPPTYLTVTELKQQMKNQEDAERARPVFHNDLHDAGEPGTDPMETLRRLLPVYDRIQQTAARQIRAGETAITAIVAGYPPAGGEASNGPDWRPPVGAVPGIPIVFDPGLPPNVWQLVDPTTGEVLFEGAVGPAVEDRARVIRDCLDEIAEDTGSPPFPF